MKGAAREALLLAALALGLRLTGVWFGLPGVTHDDEWQYVQQGAGMLERWSPVVRVNPPEESYINPTGMKLLCALACAPLDAWLSGGLPGGEGARLRYRTHRGAWHVAGRLLSALLGTAGVLLTWTATRRLAGRRAALLAAALLALSPLHVRDSHFAVSDVAAAAWCAGALWLLARGPGARPRAWALGLGAFLGAACATKYSLGLLLLPVALGVALRSPAGQRARGLVLAAAAAVATFLLLFPAAVLDAGAFLASFRYQASLGAAPWPGQDQPAAWARALVPITPSGAAVLEALVLALGAPGLALAALGLVRLSRTRVELALLAPVWVLTFARTPLFAARFLIPLLPLLAITAGLGLRAAPRRLVLPLVGAVLLWPAVHAVRIVHLLCLRDTRVDLHAFLEERVAAGDAVQVAVDESLMRYLPVGPDGRADPRLGAQGTVLPLRMGPGGVEQLAAAGYRWVAVGSSWVGLQPEPEALLAALERRGELALHVSPALPGEVVPRSLEERLAPWRHAFARARPGPEIRVYRLR